ncbi:MAG TPA: DEAD/DEAH box helicase [Nocardioides sp.]|nr:DEAD/DEAH box helicase [Nocardioides sp.]
MTATATTDVRARAEQHLRALVGREDARLYDDQWAAVEALVVARRRALVVQRTGWGKSAVYFVATLLLREQGSGPTVIISPLLALMRNQILAAERAGIRAVTINSTNVEQWQETQDAIQRGEVDVLLVSPERLNNPGFRDEVLPRLAATTGLLVVDEAHCISDWGHDFRPDYRRIRTLLDELPDGIPVLATTATANQRVTDDVAEQLSNDALVLRGSLDRETLRLGVVRLATAEQRLAWLADHLAEQPGSGIVYCLTVAATQEVADYLRSRGHQVAAYSGQTEATERLALEQALLGGEVKALVATSALGMGFDASLGFVVNLGAPSSPVAYYQQVGRAGRGRDLPPEGASVVLLPATEDRDIWAYFSSLAFPREELVRQTIGALADAAAPLSTAALETRVELSRTRLETMLKVLDVDGAVRRVKGGWEATGQEWQYDADRFARVAEARAREQQAMLDYLGTERCRMAFLRDQLDDPGLAADPDWQCGRCDNCGGLALPAEVSPKAVAAAADRLARPGVGIEPRKMWPTGLPAIGIERSGRIKEGAEEGRAIARLTDLGHGPALRELFREGTPDQDVPVALVRAVIALLADWRPEVDAIVVAESVARPQLVASLAAGLSRHLHRPVVGRWAVSDPSLPSGAGAANSARRVAAVGRRHRLELDDPDVVTGGRVLLVDDLVVTGWSLTLAAEALRAAGADAVLPLTLAVSA